MSTALQKALNAAFSGRGTINATIVSERDDTDYEFIVVGAFANTNGGAGVYNFSGDLVRVFPTKRQALEWIHSGAATQQRDLYS